MLIACVMNNNPIMNNNEVEYYIVTEEEGADIGEGPWESRDGAETFLDAEVGVPARVVAIRKREEYDVEQLLAQNREMAQELQRRAAQKEAAVSAIYKALRETKRENCEPAWLRVKLREALRVMEVIE